MNTKEEIYIPTRGNERNLVDEDNGEYDDAYDEEDYGEDNDDYENEGDGDYESDIVAGASNDKKSPRPSARVIFNAPNKVFNEDKENIMFSDDVWRKRNRDTTNEISLVYCFSYS